MVCGSASVVGEVVLLMFRAAITTDGGLSQARLSARSRSCVDTLRNCTILLPKHLEEEVSVNIMQRDVWKPLPPRASQGVPERPRAVKTIMNACLQKYMAELFVYLARARWLTASPGPVGTKENDSVLSRSPSLFGLRLRSRDCWGVPRLLAGCD